MKKEPYSFRPSQPPDALKLQTLPGIDPDALAEAWASMEDLTAPEVETRQRGFDRLVQLDVMRKSPLVAYLLATRLLEPELGLRVQITRCLAGLISPSTQDAPVAGAVISHLQMYLSQMRTRPIFALLQVAEADPEAAPAVTVLLKACSFAGNQLAQMLADRSMPLDVRRQAVEFAGQLGFLSALPAMERLSRRIESHLAAAESISALPAEQDDETSLLPYLREALTSLQAL